MTKDIEGKVREEIRKLVENILKTCNNDYIKTEQAIELVHRFSDKALSSILSLTTKADTDDDSCIENCVEIAILQEEIVDLKEDIEELKKLKLDMNNSSVVNGGCTSYIGRELVPLDVVEVEKIIMSEYRYNSRCFTASHSAHAICSHFSKPVIKYPEYSKHEEGCPLITGKCICGANKYNEAIIETRRLNGEDV